MNEDGNLANKNATVVVKHTNPCGVAISNSIKQKNNLEILPITSFISMCDSGWK